MSGCDSRQPHQFFPQAVRRLRDRVSKTQFARGSTEAACQFNFLGPWLKSEAPALQAVLSGSVTRRTPPISRTCDDRTLSCLSPLVCLPPTAGGDIQTGEPPAIH